MAHRSKRLAAASLLLVLAAAGAAAQTAVRQTYTVSPGLRQDLEAHRFDAAQFEGAVNGIATGLASGDLGPIVDQAGPDLRITDGAVNKVVPKTELGDLGRKLLKSPHLREDVTDDSQVIVRGDEIGLARGAFWLDQACLDTACTQKKTALVTINLP